MPGWDWGKSFLRRRAQVDKDMINKFFDNLESLGKYLFWRQNRHPEIIRNSTKSCFTVMFCGNASGELLPPYFVFKGKNKMSDWLMDGPKGSSFAYEYHKVLKLCEENDIYFVSLIPNSTNLLQPLDVCFFSPLKTQWRAVLQKWRETPQGKKLVSLPNNVFASLVKKMLAPGEKKCAANLVAAFRADLTSREHVIAKLPAYANPVEAQQNMPDTIGAELKAYVDSMRGEDL
ncbi:hypothetical protein PR048_010703, partial [Dryococelus australis]